jgi:hypothetical protein
MEAVSSVWGVSFCFFKSILVIYFCLTAAAQGIALAICSFRSRLLLAGVWFSDMPVVVAVLQ